MFLTNFKSSAWAVPIVLLPLAVFVFFVVWVKPWIDENGTALRRESKAGFLADAGFENDYDEGLEYDGGLSEFIEEVIQESSSVSYRWLYSSECFGVSTALAIASNFLFLLVIPCAFGGFDAVKKRIQFYACFFITLAAAVTLPVVYYLFYELDPTTFVILLGLHAASFMGTYISGSRFVSPAYKKAFWFA